MAGLAGAAGGQVPGAAEGRDSREVSTRTVPFASLEPLSLTQRGWLRIVHKVPDRAGQPGKARGDESPDWRRLLPAPIYQHHP